MMRFLICLALLGWVKAFRPEGRMWRLTKHGSSTSSLSTPGPPLPSEGGIPYVGIREEDVEQERDLDLILSERAKRFYDPRLGASREACLLVAVETKQPERAAALSSWGDQQFSFEESLSELSELVGTAGLEVYGVVIQKLSTPNLRTYVGPGKISEIMALVNETNARTLVVDDDLTPKQQLSMEAALSQWGGSDVKVLDRTALILEIFAQHARTREGQLQVELAQLQYRLTRGPSARGDSSTSDVGGKNSGAGFRGPGETKLETDKRAIRDKIVLLKRELLGLDARREQHRAGRSRLGLPVVALVGYTNAGKSSLLNVLSRAGVLAENMLFATLDNTIRKVRLDRGVWDKSNRAAGGVSAPTGGGTGTGVSGVASDFSDFSTEAAPTIENTLGTKKGQEILVTDTVGFISKLPTDLVAAFRATLDEARNADVLVHVCDRSSPVWEKQRETVLAELDALGVDTPVVELWNKVDALADPEAVMLEAACLPVDVEGQVLEEEEEGEEGREGEGIDGGVSGEFLLLDEAGGAASVGEGLDEEEEDEDKEEEDEEEEEEGYLTEGAYSEHIASLVPLADSSLSSYDSFSADGTLVAVAGGQVDYDSSTSSQESRSSRVGRGRTRAPRINRKTFTVAASVKTGLGFDDFVGTLIDALSLRLREIEVMVPYNKDDGIVAAIHNQGVVLEMAYGEVGTRIRCRVPPSLEARLRDRGLRMPLSSTPRDSA